MSVKKDNSFDYHSILPSSKKEGESSKNHQGSLTPTQKTTSEIPKTLSSKGLIESSQDNPQSFSNSLSVEKEEKSLVENFSSPEKNLETKEQNEFQEPLSYTEERKIAKKIKAREKNERLLSRDSWIKRNGHTLSYVGIFLFTLVLYFRPYELIPALSGFKSLALYLAVATLLIFIPTQFSTEGNLTSRPSEVNYLLLMTLVALLTMPISRSPAQAWETFNDVYVKIVLMFIVMVNVLRTEARLRGMLWLSIGIGTLLSFQAFQNYREGKFTVEDYRVAVDFGGMFGNPNELATHFAMFLPVAVALLFGSKKLQSKLIYTVSGILMIAGIMVTFSRGAFLGLLVSMFIFAWKLGRNSRFKVMAISSVVSIIFILAAPGNYGQRILSIFIPSLDAVGSSDQRKELLIQSLLVTIRQPWGVGMGCFHLGSVKHLETHNAFTQVSSELGILGFICYMALLIIPFRRLGAIERELFEEDNRNWIYYLAIGLQASIAAYLMASFFGSYAYNWFVYYPIAYSVALRRIYLTQSPTERGKNIAESLGFSRSVKFQTLN
jgi:O-antigen ligase